MLMVTNSIVAIMFNSFLLPMTEEVRVCSSHSPSALMLCISATLIMNWTLLLKCLLSGRLPELRNKGKDPSAFHAVGYGSGRLRDL